MRKSHKDEFVSGDGADLFKSMSAKTLQLLLIAAAIFYLILPYDLIPDFFGLAGRLDDLLMVAWLTWLYQTRGAEWIKQAAEKAQAGGAASSGSHSAHQAGGAGSAGATRENPVAGPHSVLGIEAGASADEIREAYRERMQEYHPDKVAHLGQELQDLALEKSQEIQRAYRALTE